MHEETYTRPLSRGVHDATLHFVNMSVLCLRGKEKNSTFNTSAGEQTVVATVPCVKIWLGFVPGKITSYGGVKGPKQKKQRAEASHTAAKLAPKWQIILSSKYFVLSISALKKSYLERSKG